jgi:hypothetical protein
MKKRGLIGLVIFLLVLPLALAAHTATITTTYAPIYETNPVNITLTVDNDLFSTNSINAVDLQTTGFAINNVVQLIGWTLTNNNSINFFTTTNAISNWGLQRFGFSATADNVNQDTTYAWTVTTTDTAAGTQQNTLQLQVLNDNTPPVITGTTPGLFTLGTNNELFSVDATDPETGIASSNLYLSNCDLIFNNATNSSSAAYSTITLACASGVCSSNQDLSSWQEGDVCFYYDVSNRGGETATTNNLTTIIDRTPPTVTLLSPANNALFNVTAINLDFTAQDNYDTQLDCIVDVNGNQNAVVTSTVNNTFAFTGNDGTYTWSVQCTDEVALTGNSGSQSFLIDTQAPNITLQAPSVVDRGTAAVVNVAITDTGAGVDQNSIVAEVIDTNNNVTVVTITNNQISYPTTTATIPGMYTVRVSASDVLGHSTTQTAQFRVRETFTITLSLPSNTDASTANITRYANLSGTIVRDDSVIPAGTVDVIGLIANTTLVIDNQTGAFAISLQVPQTNGVYTIIVSFINGIDTFTQTTPISVGPYCGNGAIDNNEQCDGSNLNGQSCSSFGYSQGTVSCTASCTLVTTQCSNPPPQQSNSGGSSGGSGGSSSGYIVPPQIITPAELLIVDNGASGIIEPEVVEETQPVADVIVLTNTTDDGSSIGIGASWAAVTKFTKKMNRNVLLALIIIGMLLYVFGFRKREDEWDRYFKRHGQH